MNKKVWGFLFSKATIVLCLLLFTSLQSYAQSAAKNWAFGNFELDFNSGSPTVTRNFAEHLNRGMGVISDESGALLFYTDGYSVWNKHHQLMPNGTNLLPTHGSTSTQESIIIPKPSSRNIFYILSVDPWNGQESSGLYYSEVDILLEGGLGDVTSKGIKLLDQTSNNLSAAFHANQEDVWVMTHQHNSNKYYALLITREGISAQILEQEVGRTHGYWAGQLKFSPDGHRVAVSYSDPTDGVSLFNFDPESGALSNAMDFSFEDVDTSPIIQGLAFSSDATKLYTYEARYDHIYQFDLSLYTHDAIQDSRKALKERVIYNSFKYFQLGPDGKIYATKGGGGGGTDYLGVILNPNVVAEEVEVEENGLFLEGGDSFVNYTPNFIQNYFFKTSFKFNNTCQARPINFEITNDYELDSVKWFFGEGSSSDLLNPQFQYEEAGTYTVQLLAYYPGKVDTIIRQVTINPFPPLELGEDKTVCFGSELSVEDKFSAYSWNTGDTIPSVKIKQDGWYKLTVANEFGCLSSDSIYITVIDLPEINLPDTIQISGRDPVLLDPGTFSSYSWSTGQTSSTIRVDEEGWYSVAVENDFGCLSAKSVFVMEGEKNENSEKSPWVRLNPTPTGLSGLDSYFINDQIGFIVNDKELLRTKDGGKTWEIQMEISSGRRIAFKNMIGYIIGENGSIYKSTHLGGGWNKLPFDFSDNLNAITLVHQDTLLVTSDHKLFVSNDGGRSWESRNIEGNGIDVEDSFFTSSEVGHVACKSGTILKTIDGGNSWYATESSNSIPSDFFRITFIDEKTGFASQEHNDLYKTTDGGETWSEIPVSLDAAYSIQFINEKVGFLAGEYGAIHKTLDGGDTWEWAGFDGRRYATDLYSIFFINELEGYATGLSGRIIKTTNGGASWSEYSITYNLISQLNFTSLETGYALVGNEIIKTTNKGRDWLNLGAPLNQQKAVQFDFIDDQKGYAILGGEVGTSANSGSVYKTLDGGVSWSKTHDSYEILSEDLYCIEFIDENVGFVSGGYSGDAILKTNDGGKNWKQVESISLGQMQFLNLQVGFGRNVGSYYNRIYKTVDGGESWQIAIELEEEINSFHFLDESTGYFVGENGLMYKTENGGSSWQKLEVPYEDYEYVKFYSAEVGYILSDDGALLTTKNGGRTWENIHQLYGIRSIEINDQDIYIAGERGSILTSVISFQDLVELSSVSLIAISDSTAKVSSYLRSSLNLASAHLYVEIGRQRGVYDQRFEVESFTGNGTQELNYEFRDLGADSRYFCRFIMVDGDKTVVSPELSFITLKKEEVITGIGHEELNSRVNIYPNPTKGLIEIEAYQGADAFTFEIYCTAGHLLLQGHASTKKSIDISSFNPGLYILKLSYGNERFTRKVIKH